ncbi:MAG: glycoside hydrolase family 28 protein [Clostridia bacterium]|nr:glycoside hydrolase family 28 protein [Clostridia bacterium]
MKILTVTARSATFEIENGKAPYFSQNKYEIKLNGKLVRSDDRNVFSLFSLEPDSEYEVEACGEFIKFKTLKVDCLFSVKDFNAYGDGVHDDTAAFAAAISCIPENSTLYVPAGTYFITPLFLKSGVTIYLEKGAVILANPDRNVYPVLPALVGGNNLGTWQGEEADCFASIITAYKCKNIAIIGEGEINCNALAGDWYKNHRVKRVAWRPRGVFFNRCQNVLMQGITLRDTPSWNVHPYFCKDVKLFDLNLKNIPTMPTTDGIDPDCCDGVEIAGVNISVGDDCIAIKSGTLEFAKKYRTPSRNIKITNCLMREGHGGVVFGSELSGGIENVIVTKCIFEGTDRGLRIKTRRGRGRIGKCGGVTFSDIEMKNVKVPFVINMYYNMGDENGHTEYVYTTKKLPVDDRTPEVGAFTFKNMTCSGVEYCAGAFYGLPEAPIKCITFENVSFTYNKNVEAGFPDMREENEAVKNLGLDFRFVEEVKLKNVNISGQEGEEVLLEEVGKFTKL